MRNYVIATSGSLRYDSQFKTTILRHVYSQLIHVLWQGIELTTVVSEGLGMLLSHVLYQYISRVVAVRTYAPMDVRMVLAVRMHACARVIRALDIGGRDN